MTRESARVVILGAAGRDFHNFNVVELICRRAGVTHVVFAYSDVSHQP